MKILRTVVCVILAVTMVLVLSECDIYENVDDTSEPSVPTVTGDEDGAAKESAVISVSPDPSEGRQDLVILDWEQYVTRPHGIQPETVLNYAVSNDVPSQLPWNCPGDGWLTGNIYEGLLYMYMNDPGDIRGCIAESWACSDDYLTWTFRIREGVKFTDGTACDANAIAEAWDYLKKEAPAYLVNYNIKSWEAVSDSEFVVHMSAPSGLFETALCGSSMLIASPTALGIYGIDDNRAAVGTGPYYIDSYTPEEGIALKANTDYYLEEKMPCIETVYFRFIREQDTVVDSLKSGEIDGVNISDNKAVNIETYRTLLESSYGGHLVACLGYPNPLWLNAMYISVFQNIEVREAMCRVIDFGAINDRIYDGLGCVQDSLWAKGSSGYVQTDQFYYDPEEGLALLASVGVLTYDIKIEVISFEEDEDMYFAVQKELEKVGIELGVEPLSPGDSLLWYGQGRWPTMFQSVNYRNTTPYAPWTYVLKPKAIFKLCWQDIYDPDLYQKMLGEYDAMMGAATWDEMLAHCRQLTAYEQDDFGAFGTVQPPAFMALGEAFKNGVYFTEDHWLQLYYLYQQRPESEYQVQP